MNADVGDGGKNSYHKFCEVPAGWRAKERRYLGKVGSRHWCNTRSNRHCHKRAKLRVYLILGSRVVILPFLVSDNNGSDVIMLLFARRLPPHPHVPQTTMSIFRFPAFLIAGKTHAGTCQIARQFCGRNILRIPAAAQPSDAP